MATSPAGCGADVVPQFEVHVGPDGVARGARVVLNGTPAEGGVSLEMMVLLMMFATNASCSKIPAPSQPATLSAMMLLVIFTEYQLEGVVGNVITSEPLTLCKRRPPPLPLSAALPMIRLALITRPGPVPPPGRLCVGGTQSASVVAPHGGSTSGAPITRIPPPLAGMAGLGH